MKKILFQKYEKPNEQILFAAQPKNSSLSVSLIVEHCTSHTT